MTCLLKISFVLLLQVEYDDPLLLVVLDLLVGALLLEGTNLPLPVVDLLFEVVALPLLQDRELLLVSLLLFLLVLEFVDLVLEKVHAFLLVFDDHFQLPDRLILIVFQLFNLLLGSYQGRYELISAVSGERQSQQVWLRGGCR